MENVARRDDENAAAAAAEDEARAAAPTADVEAAPDPERMRIDWLKAIAVLVITIATVFIAIKGFTYREEIGEWAKQTFRPDVQVLLRASPSHMPETEGSRGILKLDVAGRAMVHGEALQNGVMRIVVEDIDTQQYLGGDIVEIKSGEPFEVALLLAPDARGARSASVGLRAAVTGVHRGKPVNGETSINIGFPRAASQSAAWIAGAVLALITLAMIWLFTGNIHTRKQRWLYATMYFLVFAALALPVAVSVLVVQSSYVVEMMERSPVGLVRGTSPGAKSEPQWLLNVGGVATARGENSVQLEGGLAVPVYVVLLALAGAAINLVRRVPELQEEYRSGVRQSRPFPAWLHKPPPEDPLGEDDQRRQTSAFRRALVQNIVYLLAAPLLAIAAYYLLQVVAAEPPRALVVVLALLTGLVADSLIGGLFRVAETTLRSAPADEAASALANANARIAHINAHVREEQAKLAESIFLAQAARAREDIIAARADRSLDMPGVPGFEPVAPMAADHREGTQ